MIFYATSGLHQSDILAEEARMAGAQEIVPSASGVHFTGDMRTAYRFLLTTHTATRLLLGIYEDDDIRSADEFYDASMLIPWEEWIDPSMSFAVTITMKNVRYLKHSNFGALRLKDAIVDRIREHFDGQRPNVDRDESDLIFHAHLEGDRATWFVDLSGQSHHKRGYRGGQTDALLAEHLAFSILYRSQWRKLADETGSFPTLLDPFCGSGTILIEAALWATKRAPGLVKARIFPVFNLPIHDVDLYEEIVDEVVSHIEEGDFSIHGWDRSPKAIRIAREAAREAGIDHLITFEVKDFTTLTEEDIPPSAGVIVTDPPYGMRMGQWEDTRHLYRSIGDTLTQFFGGWNVSLLTADDRLLSQIDLKPNRTNAFNNGGIPCTLAHYYIFTDKEKAALRAEWEERRKERLSQPLSSGAQMAYNRLVKNLKELRPIMEEEGVTSYRIYDADMIEYNAAIDLYEGRWINLAEYAAPPTVDIEDAERRLGELIDATERATGVDREFIFVKQRTVQKGLKQYERRAYTDQFYIINENDARYFVNFTDYLDTGIFLDHRPIRKYISEITDHKRFLNLFCYTGTATVQAAKGGALSTVSVDTSTTYLDWAKRNMELNGFGGMNHFYYQSDSISFLWDTFDRYDVIFCDPPTYSNSKDRAPFEVQKDHRSLIKACMMHLDPGGLLIFSCNYRSFRMDEEVYDEFDVEEITPQTIGKDFSRDPKIHHVFLIRERATVVMQAQRPRRAIRRKPID